MSEAARHQAMPQPALFAPKSTNNGNFNRGNANAGNSGRGNPNPSSGHRSGGRGR